MQYIPYFMHPTKYLLKSHLAQNTKRMYVHWKTRKINHSNIIEKVRHPTFNYPLSFLTQNHKCQLSFNNFLRAQLISHLKEPMHDIFSIFFIWLWFVWLSGGIEKSCWKCVLVKCASRQVGKVNDEWKEI